MPSFFRPLHVVVSWCPRTDSVVAWNRSGMVSSGRISAIVIDRKSRLAHSYCDVGSYAAKNFRLLESNSHIGNGLLSNRNGGCTSGWHNCPLSSFFRATNITAAATNVVNRIEMV